MHPFAAIDIGSNTVRLVIMETDGRGGLLELNSERVICRLGEGIHQEKRLLEPRIDRVIEALKGFRGTCRRYGDLPIRAVATSAVREASNRDEFVARVRRETGIAVEVIPWEEEAALTLEGVFWKLPDEGKTNLIFDIGGGSTEFILCRGRDILATAGTGLGVVRLTERFISTHPVPEGEFRELAGFLSRELAQVHEQLGRPRPERLIGTAGTVTTLAALDGDIYPYDPETIHGAVLPRETVLRWLGDLRAMSLEQRRQLRCLEAGREDLIIAGTALVAQTLETFACPALTVSEYSLREGILLKTFGDTINQDLPPTG